jgi:tRNA-intron endonuclease, archaea type
MAEKIKAKLIGEKVSSNSKLALDLFSSQRFGEVDAEKVFYSLPEAVFLAETNKIEITDSKNKKVSLKELMKRFEKIDKKFRTKYLVFKDLRSRGLIVKTALKFGAEFRVYEKGKNIGKDHAKWILFPIAETEQLTWHDFSAKNRVAHSTKKNLLIAIVDEENDVSYYEVKWIRP